MAGAVGSVDRLLALPLGKKTEGTAAAFEEPAAAVGAAAVVAACCRTWLSLFIRKMPLPWALRAGLRMNVLLLPCCFLNASTNRA